MRETNKWAVLLCLMAATTVCQGQSNRVILNDDDKAKIGFLGRKGISKSDTIWRLGGSGSLNFTQSYYSNWASGGQNSLAGTAIMSLYAKYRKKRSSWDNTLDMSYGQLSQDDRAPIKTDDRIDFTSKYGYNAKNPKWYYSGLLNFRSQFAPGFEIVDGKEVGDKISDFLAPGYIIGSLGFDYKPNDVFSALLSPVTSKVTLVSVDRLASEYGLGVGENIRFEIGAFIKLSYQKDVLENVNYQTRIDLFSNYINKPENIDINWENLITMKINKWLSTTLSTQLIYDDDINILLSETTQIINGEEVTIETRGPRTQFKEVFALGISVKF